MVENVLIVFHLALWSLMSAWVSVKILHYSTPDQHSPSYVTPPSKTWSSHPNFKQSHLNAVPWLMGIMKPTHSCTQSQIHLPTQLLTMPFYVINYEDLSWPMLLGLDFMDMIRIQLY